MSSTTAFRARKLAILLPLLLMAFAFMMPTSAFAQESPDKTVRVGWYDSSFNNMDDSGRRSGYAYEYQMKVASYTGWTFEYVNGSWSDLMELLARGEIDLMSDVSYTPEREKTMLFPSVPMGTEEYYLFIASDNQEIVSTDPSTLNGKRVGINKGSIQTGFFKNWEKQHGVQAEIIETTGSEDESERMVENGALDAYITVDFFTDPDRLAPVWKIGSSDFYFAVNKNRPDLLTDLNYALSKIQDENRYYNEQLFEKHIKRAGANAFLASDELAWLSEHGPIRVGYQDNYLAFCAEDKATGEPIGALKDYLDYASDCLANAHIDFATKAYPTMSSALDAMKAGEVDCVFPVNLSVYDGEELDAVMTPSLMSADINAVVRESDQGIFTKKEHVIVAVNEGNPNYDAFLLDHFPTWRKVYYPDTEQCLKAVADGVADCVLISSYRYNNVSRLCKQYHLTSLTTGFIINYYFAVSSGNSELYSILTKVVSMVPSSTVNTALSYYITEDAKLSFYDFIIDNLAMVVAAIVIVLLIILVLLVRSMRAERKARQLISATEIDSLTGLYNRGFFFQYANSMYQEHPTTPMDALVLNIEQFHTVNDLNGRMFGDQVLRTLGNEIRAVAEESDGIAGRFEADRFDIYCRHQRHEKNYHAILERIQGKLDGLAPNTNIRLRMGVMPWQEGLEPVQLFDRARTACSMARGHYSEPLIVFDEQVRKREIFDQRLLNDLRRALDAYEFEIYYQPKYNIDHNPPELEGAEALVRWNHSELGIIPPDDFIPLLERNGQIGVLDKYVWEEVARQIVRWQTEYGVTVPVSVNLSRVDVFDPELENTLDGILSRYGLDKSTFKLEVTESAYTENADQVVEVVENLRKKGYEVGMDDFGTGYSSLNMLSAMPIDFLKMDRAFIQNMEHDERDVQLVALIIGIARSLNIPVIAEGVETGNQLELLRELGCALVQGYYFSRPLHVEDFEDKFIRNMRPENQTSNTQ